VCQFVPFFEETTALAIPRCLLYDLGMKLTIKTEREEDGRWIAEVLELSGVLVYADSRDEAIAAAEVLALRVIADRLDNGEPVAPQPLSVSFVAA
jgi:predicted RNase H-like HicB family nuclease